MDGNVAYVGLEREKIGIIVFSQKGTRLLTVADYVFQLTKKYTPKNGGDNVFFLFSALRQVQTSTFATPLSVVPSP